MIPEAAVEAAAKAHFEISTNQYMPWEQIDAAYRSAEYIFPMRAALEAAAPHMLADAWQRGNRAAVGRDNPYKQAEER